MWVHIMANIFTYTGSLNTKLVRIIDTAPNEFKTNLIPNDVSRIFHETSHTHVICQFLDT